MTGAEIKALRSKHGITQFELARRLDRSISFMSEYENYIGEVPRHVELLILDAIPEERKNGA